MGFIFSKPRMEAICFSSHDLSMTNAAPLENNLSKRNADINRRFPFCGALPDEGVKNNMPVAYFLAGEALRAEPERRSANGETAPAGGKCNKKGRTNVLPFCGALPGTRTLGPLIKSQLLYQLS